MITHCTRADFDQIVTHIDEFWGDDRALPLHHPMFFYEFGDTAWVIRDGDLVAAYLFGFFAQTAPVAYAHLLAVRAGYRRRGLACGLYEHFIRAPVASHQTPNPVPFFAGVIVMGVVSVLGLYLYGRLVAPHPEAR